MTALVLGPRNLNVWKKTTPAAWGGIYVTARVDVATLASAKGETTDDEDVGILSLLDYFFSERPGTSNARV